MKTHFFNLPLRFATTLCVLLLAAAHPVFGDVTFSGDTSNNGTDVIVGDTGNGSLTIDGGSSLSNSIGYVGNQANSFGSVTVSSGTWTNSDSLTIGNSGTGSLTISGGTVSNTNGTLGNSAGSNGTATVATGGAWTTMGDLFIGYAGNGNLTVSGGTVSNVNGVIGVIGEDVEADITGSNGIVTISGGNWTNSGSLTVGSGGNGTLAVSGGTVSNVNGVIGYNSSATISGGNWTNSGNLYIDTNNSTLTIETGGLVTVAGTLTKTSTGIININAGGSLSIGVGGTTGELNTNGAFTYNGTLIFNRTAGYTYSGNLGGSGSLIKQGSNALILTGTNTYNGTTTISSGTLQIGNGALTGSISSSSNIINNAILDFKSSNNQTYGGQISGSGALNKRQGGTLILSGNNTYTGDTTIYAGTLQIGNGGTSGSLVSNVSGGPLVFNRSDSSTYGGVFSGSTLTKLGAGTLTLTGNNTNSGGTTISAGTLQIGAGGTSGAISNSSGITNNANLAFNRSDATSYTSVISGSGNLTQLGAGTLIFSGNNTYTGTTTISAGTLQIGAGGTSGAISNSSNITNNAALVFNRSDDTTYAGSISGTGAVTKSGSGTLTISGNNTYTGATAISAGTLQIGSVNALGSGGNITFGGGTLQFGSGITTDVSSRLKNSVTAIQIDTDNNNITFASDVDATNTGGLTKLGSGNLTLTGNNTYTGGTTVNAGTLLVTGSTSSVIVNNSGTLGGNGTLGAVTINSGGTIAPGNSPGTITVGNLTLNGGSIYNWQTSSINGTAGTDWDLIASAGTLTLNATSGNPITISLSTLGSATLAGVKNASWQIGNFTSSINGFDASAFTFNSSNMTGTAGGYFLSLGSGNTTLLLNYKTAATWNTATGNWSTAAQWDGGSLPSNGDAIEFSGSGGVSTNNSFLNSASGLTFLAGAGSYTVNGSALTLLGEGIVNDSANTQTLALNLTLGANQTFTANTANLIVSGVISGNATLSKSGNATLTLTGNNSYTGGTTVSAGTLALGGTAGAISGNISVGFGATFAVNRSNSATISNVISGAGAFAHIGSGVTSMGTNNTYSGGTSIQSGTLWVKAPQALGTGNVALNGGKLLISSSQEMGGDLQVGGNVNWSGGTIAFYDTGSSPAAGDLTIGVTGNFVATSGNKTFDFSQVEALDYGAYTLVNATALSAGGVTFLATHGPNTTLLGNFTTSNHTIIYTVTGATSGGTDIQNNGGPNTPFVANYNITVPTITVGANNMVNALTFTGSNSLTINATGQLTVASGTLNVQSGSSVVSGGTLNTPGNFNKTGDGRLNLQSNASINGTANVDAGILSVNGQLNANSVVVAPGGTLGGSGVIVAQNVRVNGNLSPGNSPGTLNVVGNLVLTGANSTIIEIASPTTFDRIIVSGQVTLGGALNAVAYGGATITPGTRYDFLQAGSIVGAFDSLIAPDGLRVRFLNSGTVGTLLFGPSSYVPMAINQNQRNVAKALDTFVRATNGDRLAASIALDSLTTQQFPAAFNQILPGYYESLTNIAIEQAFAQTQMLNQRMSSVRFGAAGFQALGASANRL